MISRLPAVPTGAASRGSRPPYAPPSRCPAAAPSTPVARPRHRDACVTAPKAGSPRQRASADAAHIIASFPPPPQAVRTGRPCFSPSLTAPGEGPAATPDVMTATHWVDRSRPADGRAGLGPRPHPGGVQPRGWGSAQLTSPAGLDPSHHPASADLVHQFGCQSWPRADSALAAGHSRRSRRARPRSVTRRWSRFPLTPPPSAFRHAVVTVTPVFDSSRGKTSSRSTRHHVTDPPSAHRSRDRQPGPLPARMFNCPATSRQMRSSSAPHPPPLPQYALTFSSRRMPALSDYTGSGQRQHGCWPSPASAGRTHRARRGCRPSRPGEPT